MSRYGRKVQGVCSNPACGRTFMRRPYELARAKRSFCSHRCSAQASPGPTMVLLTCAGCGVSFKREAFKARGKLSHYCGQHCERTRRDHAALARESWKTRPQRRAPSPLVRLERARKGGLARAAALSPERLREISQLGVAARQARAKPARVKRSGKFSKSFGGSWLATLEPVLP